MPLVATDYAGGPLWCDGHVQTILPTLWPRVLPRWHVVERLVLPDGDFVTVKRLTSGHARVAVVCHGLEGSADADYVRGVAGELAAAGWDVVGWNFRGCGGEENQMMRAYHSGETEDLRVVAARVARGYRSLALIGFSLGGNVVLKAAAEGGLPDSLAGVAAVSAPVDLASSARRLDEVRGNRIYQKRFLKTLIAKTLEKSQRFPELGVRLAGADGVAAVRTIREFDERITAPIHGFAGADDYYARASAAPLLGRLTVPALLLNARNDPLLEAASFPEATAGASEWLHLEATAYGGHVGFLDLRRGRRPWHERRVVEFLNGVSAR